jgi:hypothetical protein
VGFITTQAVVTTLIALKLITADSASAQPREDQGSPTLQRLRQLHQVEEDRKAAEDAKWRSFRIDDVKSAGSLIFDALTNRPPKCEFYWPGWKVGQDEVRITSTRGCYWEKVAVNCKSLKISWHKPALNKYSPETAYWTKWIMPNTSTERGLEDSRMVAALCDSTIRPELKSALSKVVLANNFEQNPDSILQDLFLQSPGGWRLVGINSKAAVWWIKPSTVTGDATDRSVLKLSINPDRPTRLLQSRVFINCKTAQMQQTLSADSQIRTPSLLINKGSTWDTIAKAICPAGSYSKLGLFQPSAPLK